MKRLRRPAGEARLRPGAGTRRLARRLLLAIAVLFILAAGVVGGLVFFSDTFDINDVRVKGNSRLDAGYIRQLSLVDSYGSLLTLPVDNVARNLEQDPWIREARIGRRLPGTVDMVIVERVPMAMLDYGGTGFLVDDTGYLICASRPDESPELPRVHCGDLPPPRISGRPSHAGVRDCLKVIASMAPETRDVLLLANPFDERGQVFQTRLGFNIVYGRASDLPKKNEALQVVTTDVKNNGRKISYIDVRVPDSPVIAPL